MNQQETLAKEKAPQGGGYVCMILRQGSDKWDFVLATKSSNEADNWWAGQTRGARVWRVKSNGETLIFSAK